MKKIIFFLSFMVCQITMAQVVNIPDANFLNKLTGGAGVDTNGDGIIQVSEAESVTTLVVDLANISSLEGIQSFVNMTSLYCQSNLLTTLDLSNLPNLEVLHAFDNQLTSLILPTDSKIRFIGIYDNDLTSLDLSNQSELDNLHCWRNDLVDLNISGLTKLKVVQCNFNQINALDVSAAIDLQELNCGDNQIKSLDFTNQIGDLEVSCSSNLLETLFVKNNHINQTFQLGGNPTLQYICTDFGELADFQQQINSLGYSNCVVSTVCPFNTPGPVHHINGNVQVDLNGNGCDPTDNPVPYFLMKARLAVGENEEITYFSTDKNGSYDMRLVEGSYTIEYQSPYTNFIASPNSFQVDLDATNSPYTQDICLTPNGSIDDLQLTIIPLQQARPGFDASYQVLFTNVGTTQMSGDVNFLYEEDVLNFVNASETPNSQTSGQLSWSFSALDPLESRSIEVTLNLNAPTDTPPLNGGDILVLQGTVLPTNNDATPNDNTFALKQTVVNSYDPNDKTCLEGDVITPDLVGEYVHYLIRFENTGSASAINVVIKDVIDTNKFDMSSFVPMEASHNYVTQIENVNDVQFIFEDIHLPFDDANNDGFVLFKIKTLPSLNVGDTFENSAEIYFDFNFPIITNVEQTTVDTTASAGDFALNSDINLFPNPAENRLQIESQLNFDTIVIYDLTGKEIQRVVSTENRLSQEIDVSQFKSGIYYLSILSGRSKTIHKFLKQ